MHSKTKTRRPVRNSDADIAKLLGRPVLVRSRNIAIAEWENGVLERLDLAADGESFAYIRMKGRLSMLHKISLREYMVKRH